MLLINLQSGAKPDASGSRLSVSTRRQSVKAKEESQDTTKVTDGSVKTPDKRKPLFQGSILSSMELPESDDEDLLDLEYGTHGSLPSKVPLVIPRRLIESTSKPRPTAPSRRPRTTSRRWWRKKSSQGVKRSRAHAAGKAISSVKATAPVVVRPRQPGDVLSGLSSGRIRQIRKSLVQSGVEKHIDGKAAFKDVSVDIINCWCGLTDEHGLMIQVCYCYIKWEIYTVCLNFNSSINFIYF